MNIVRNNSKSYKYERFMQKWGERIEGNWYKNAKKYGEGVAWQILNSELDTLESYSYAEWLEDTEYN